MTATVTTPPARPAPGPGDPSSEDFAFADEVLEFRAVLRRFLERHAAEPEVRRLMATPTGHDPALWTALARRLGVTGLAVAERWGGGGLTPLELVVAFEECGRALACAPLLSTVGMAGSLLSRVPEHPAAARFLPGIVDGSVLGTVVLTDADGGWEVDRPGVRAEPTAAGWVLHGAATSVLDAGIADVVLAGAATPDGVSVFLVERGAPGLTAIALDGLDPTRRDGRLEFHRTPAQLVGAAGDGPVHLTAVRDLAAVYLAAEQAGGAQRLLETVVDHARQRVQFGRPIGSFQAVKHRCADMLLWVESAKSAVYHAGRAAAESRADAPALASLAKAYCSEAYVEVARSAIQLLGGIGFTWEHPAHLFYRRAISGNALLGDPYLHRERLARELGV